MSYYLLFILCLFYTLEMILDKKQIRMMFFFFFEYKMGHKAAATTHNTNSTFGPGIANKCIVQR